MTRKILLVSVLGLMFIGVSTPLSAQPAYDMLSVTEDGLYYKNRLDISDWKPGEDFIYLRSYYVPWNGEDSIDYEISLKQLKINGQVVGVNLVGEKLENVPAKENIETVQVDPDQLSEVTELPGVVAVSLVGIKNEQDLAKLSQLPDLKALDLSYAKISDVALSLLEPLEELRVLNLSNTEISDAGLKHLSSLKNLRTLDLESTDITDEGLTYLKDLENLRSLNLFRTRVGGGAETLALRGKPLKVTDEGIKALAGLGKLSELNLHGAAITDQGIKYIANISSQTMTNLRRLNLSATAITDASVPDLATLKGLRSLDIKGTAISPAKVAELRAKLPDCEITY